KEIEKQWLHYEKDLATLSIFNDQERRLARALVWRRVSEIWRKSHVPEGSVLGRFAKKDDRDRLLECAEKCVELAPEHAFAYRALIEAFETLGDDPGAAKARRRLLQRFPDDAEAHSWLLAYYLLYDEPQKALAHAEHARKLQPLDESLRAAAAEARVALARQLALEDRFAEAREQFALAEQVFPPNKEDFTVLACRAVLEERAGDEEAAQQWRTRAGASLVEATPLTLALAAETRRYKLPVTRAKQWNDQWKKELKQKCNSETAGAMCRLMARRLVDGAEYVGRSGHISELKKYIRRCTRVKWREEDLRHVCRFLRELYESDPRDNPRLLEDCLDKGMRVFPQSPFFHFHRGELEVELGPFDCDRYLAHECFSKAAKYAENSPFPEDASILEDARKRLTFLGEVGMPTSPPFSFMDQFFESSYEDDDDDDWEEDEEPLSPEMFDHPAARELLELMAKKMGIDPNAALDAMTREDFERDGDPLPGPHPRKGASPHRSKRK
ncbi:MAG: hypothetical protein KY475_15360, partial [Planctomycetes bacterium]|nr:hypothetical protein [Planctomycetota bacterium]